jgi:DNA uptake protein ComE-like DNA-binding protein
MTSRRRGSVFVVTLAVMTGLIAILVAASAAQRSKLDAVLNRTEGDRAKMAAEAGVQRALAELSLMTPGQAVTLQDDWATLGNSASERFQVGKASFRLQIVDAASFVNLNTATQEQLQRMPFTQEQIDSLLDWREAGNTPRLEGGKDEYYNNLPRPYNTALRRFNSFDELFAVKGFTPRALYEPQTDVVSTATLQQGQTEDQPALDALSTVDSYSPQSNADGQTKVNVNANGTTAQTLIQRGLPAAIAAQIFQLRPFTRIGDVLALAGANRQAQQIILDELTISAAARVEGKINLNTATESVMNTVPNLPSDVVETILSRQQQGFTRLSDLLDVPGMSGQTLTGSVDAFTVQSNAFLIRVEGTAGSSRAYFEVLVTFENDLPRITRVETPPFLNMPERWNWPDETTTETVLGDESE